MILPERWNRSLPSEDKGRLLRRGFKALTAVTAKSKAIIIKKALKAAVNTMPTHKFSESLSIGYFNAWLPQEFFCESLSTRRSKVLRAQAGRENFKYK